MLFVVVMTAIIQLYFSVVMNTVLSVQATELMCSNRSASFALCPSFRCFHPNGSVNVPLRIDLETLLKIFISNTVVMTPSMVPNWEPSPSEMSIRKKQIAQNGPPGSSTMACVNTMNARPVPSAACRRSGHTRSADDIRSGQVTCGVTLELSGRLMEVRSYFVRFVKWQTNTTELILLN